MELIVLRYKGISFNKLGWSPTMCGSAHRYRNIAPALSSLSSSWCAMLYPQTAEREEIWLEGSGKCFALCSEISQPLDFSLEYRVESLKYQIFLWTQQIYFFHLRCGFCSPFGVRNVMLSFQSLPVLGRMGFPWRVLSAPIAGFTGSTSLSFV